MSHEVTADTNDSGNTTFDSVLTARLTRRNLLGSATGTLALAAAGGTLATAAVAHDAPGYGHRALRLAFEPVAKNLEDTVTLPKGYRYDVLFALGDPISANTSDFANDGTDSPASFALRAGDHHDGMHFFGLDSNGRCNHLESGRGLLCINHEAITPAYLHPNGQTVVGGVRTVADEVRREFFVHGVSVIEIGRQQRRAYGDGSASFRRFLRPGHHTVEWDYEQKSRYNRRIHTLTEMKLSGPAARSAYMITRYSPDGARTRGTVNNCANGHTPWGTYLTCEENWAG
jgi:uncharacterized protein